MPSKQSFSVSQPDRFGVQKKPVFTTTTGGNEPKDVDDDYNYTCGIGSWRPKWLQRYAQPFFFVLNLSLVGVVQSMSGPIFIGAMSTLEKRYSFDSGISGMIMIADNISQFMASPLAGYIAVRFNRARLIAVAELFLAFSCFLSASPYFIYGAIDHSEKTTDSFFFNQTSTMTTKPKFQLCTDTSMEENYNSCYEPGRTVWPAVFLLFFGNFFRGFGFTCYFVVGFPFIDDNVSKKNSPMYLSFIQAIRLIGPAAGYLLSAMFLRFYENPLVDPGFGRRDPRFVGAWWLAFCTVGTLLFLTTLPMFLFPAQFKRAPIKAETIKNKLKQSGGSLQALKRFVKNPVVMIYTFGSVFRYIGIGGYIMLKTKYVESHFRTTAWTANVVTGTATILPIAIGIILGGIFITVFKPKAKFLLIYIFIVESFSIVTMSSGIFLGCKSINFAGDLSPIIGKYDMDRGCNSDCSCTNFIFTPVCGDEGNLTYFSPCYAGCKSYEKISQNDYLYNNCSCTESGLASNKFCKNDDCNPQLARYIILIVTGALISATARTANSLISLRSVDPLDKGFTMGALSSFMAIFAFIPYPFIFGRIANSVCLVWGSKCGKASNCWLYDQEKFRIYFHGAVIFFMCIGSIFDFIMIFFSDRIKNLYDDNDNNDDDDDDDGNTNKIPKNKMELQQASKNHG